MDATQIKEISMKEQITEQERQNNIEMYRDLFMDDPEAIREYDKAIYLSEDLWLYPNGNIGD